MKTVAVLIARQGSSRLPGKGMMPILGKPVAWHILNRLKRMRHFDAICLATSNLEQDKPLLDLAREFGAQPYAGHPTDVLERLYHAAEVAGADVVAEVGGDCPFVDPNVTRRALDLLKQTEADYVCNAEPQTYPDGLDMHVVRFKALRFAHENAILSSQRLHPFSHFHRHRDRFKTVTFQNEQNLSHYRWTLDYAEDFEVIRRVFEELNPKNELFVMKDVLDLFQRKPELFEVNRKWNMAAAETGAAPQAQAKAPTYWFTQAYIRDMLTDVSTLAEKCKVLEGKDDHEKLKLYYAELSDLVRELKERTDYFGNHKR